MTGLDLTTAAQSIADSLGVDARDQDSLALIQAAVDAAAPLIEAQVLTPIEYVLDNENDCNEALDQIARIVRGGAS